MHAPPPHTQNAPCAAIGAFQWGGCKGWLPTGLVHLHIGSFRYIAYLDVMQRRQEGIGQYFTQVTYRLDTHKGSFKYIAYLDVMQRRQRGLSARAIIVVCWEVSGGFSCCE